VVSQAFAGGMLERSIIPMRTEFWIEIDQIGMRGVLISVSRRDYPTIRRFEIFDQCIQIVLALRTCPEAKDGFCAGYNSVHI
jgi:hypothetical protein